PHLIENVSLYFEHKLDTTWTILLAKPQNMKIAIQNFMIKKYE
ncbi:9471_t:CDS:2, partial [Gigaspora margarita]